MHIAVLSDREASGGANIAASRLTEAFSAAGHRITRIYDKTEAGDPRWETRLIRSCLATHELPLARRTAARLVPQTIRLERHQRQAAHQLDAILREVHPDVISLHNLHIASWSPEMIRTAARNAPTVATLHDTWTLTGRCVFPGPCEKYISGCDESCPTSGEYPRLPPKRIHDAWALRLKIFSEAARLAAVAPSDWLGRVAETGIWRRQPVFKIPYALDLDCFSTIDRAVAKAVLGIKSEARVVVACASELSSPRKGLRLLLEALSAGLDRRINLLLMGAPLDMPAIPGVDARQIGYVIDDRLRAIVFNSADVFVHPALADNAPLTVIESLACGTPVVAFPVDGLPETVVSGRTGWLAEGVSSELLRRTMVGALNELDDGLDLRSACRRFAEERYRPADVARQYESVFRHMLTGEPTPVRRFGDHGQAIEWPELATTR